MDLQTLHRQALTRFREAFGEPHNTLGPAAHWSLACDGEELPVQLLLNAGGNQPTAWVFDQLSPNGASAMNSMTTPEHIDEVIEIVRARVKHHIQTHDDALLSFPVRINAFVHSVRGWGDQMAQGRGEHSKPETAKMHMYGMFLVDDGHFGEAYQVNRRDDCRSIDVAHGLHSTCTFFDALADVVSAGHGRLISPPLT